MMALEMAEKERLAMTHVERERKAQENLVKEMAVREKSAMVMLERERKKQEILAKEKMAKEMADRERHMAMEKEHR